MHQDRKIVPLDELWKKGMVKNIDGKVLWEEVDNLSDDGQYDVTIYFEDLTPEVVGWIMGKMNSYIHMARSINIKSTEEPQKGWRHLLEEYDEPDEIFKDYPYPEGTA